MNHLMESGILLNHESESLLNLESVLESNYESIIESIEHIKTEFEVPSRSIVGGVDSSLSSDVSPTFRLWSDSNLLSSDATPFLLVPD